LNKCREKNMVMKRLFNRPEPGLLEVPLKRTS
jgi:hypothetical protein